MSKIIIKPATSTVNDRFVIHKNDIDGKISFSIEEAILLYCDLHKFIHDASTILSLQNSGNKAT